MKCKKCIEGVIMKQIAIADFEPIPCECVIENWFNSMRR